MNQHEQDNTEQDNTELIKYFRDKLNRSLINIQYEQTVASWCQNKIKELTE